MGKLTRWSFPLVAVLLAAGPSEPAPAPSVADDIIALVRAQWAAEQAIPPNVAEEFANIADDYTEFNSDYSTRLEGKAINMKLSEANAKSSVHTIASDMANAKVQVYGDVAILSYNFVGVSIDKDGKTESDRAKSTRVYAKLDGKWKLVHANFGADPLPKP
jgi:ketosteroid isomerase-like protein